MAIGIGRRQFISALGGATVAWPLAARTQQPKLPIIGWLSGISPGAVSELTLAAFWKALGEAGFIENRNVAIEYRWAEGRYDRLPAMAAELVAHRVAVIVTQGGEPSALAAKAATSTIPIVMVASSDPVQLGLVASLNRPGGNITGASTVNQEMESKRLGLLHEVVPTAKTIAVLVNPASLVVETQLRDVRDAAPRIGVELIILKASTEAEFDGVFATMAERKADGLLVGADPFFNNHRAHLIALAAQHRLPAIYEWRDFAVEGGLMSYGTVLTDAYRQMGVYAGRILKGEKPADLPVVEPTNFKFVINLKTAKTLGLEFSPTLSARADEVIE
jgi:putative tryptophan/tyrosine transport system substrate-binding protein